MTMTHSHKVRGFVRTSQTPIRKTERLLDPADTDPSDEFLIGLFTPDGEATDETFRATWRKPSPYLLPTLKLEVSHKGWNGLPEFNDLFEELATMDVTMLDADTFGGLLRQMGIEDQSSRQRSA